MTRGAGRHDFPDHKVNLGFSVEKVGRRVYVGFDADGAEAVQQYHRRRAANPAFAAEIRRKVLFGNDRQRRKNVPVTLPTLGKKES
jgi:hypothetical protein